jgi:hypothetical protein
VWNKSLRNSHNAEEKDQTKTKKIKGKDVDEVNHTQEKEKDHFQVHFYILQPTAPMRMHPTNPERP